MYTKDYREKNESGIRERYPIDVSDPSTAALVKIANDVVFDYGTLDRDVQDAIDRLSALKEARSDKHAEFRALYTLIRNRTHWKTNPQDSDFAIAVELAAESMDDDPAPTAVRNPASPSVELWGYAVQGPRYIVRSNPDTTSDFQWEVFDADANVVFDRWNRRDDAQVAADNLNKYGDRYGKGKTND